MRVENIYVILNSSYAPWFSYKRQMILNISYQ